QHPLAFDAAKLCGLEIGDDDDLSADERGRLVARADASDDLAFVAAEVDSQDEKPVRVWMKLRRDHGRHPQVELLQVSQPRHHPAFRAPSSLRALASRDDPEAAGSRRPRAFPYAGRTRPP